MTLRLTSSTTTHACCVWHACEPRVNCTRVGQNTKKRIIDDGKQNVNWPFDCQSILHFVTPVTFARPGRTGSLVAKLFVGDSNLVIVPFLLNYASSNHAGERSFFSPAVTYRRSKTLKTETSKDAGNWGTRKGVDGIRQFFPLNRFLFFFKD